ncbi:hypothetical protein MP228_007544 [Amoeboaphelidium protococcarum]|nr:hypothetical protein MP228_007544 [Amoeboaphelidium protococcarum]
MLRISKAQNLLHVRLASSYIKYSSQATVIQRDDIKPAKGGSSCDRYYGQRQVRKVTIRDQVNAYIGLTKPRLSTLVLLTSVYGTALSPYTCAIDPYLMLHTMVGMSLCIGSANAFNQILEVPYDQMMPRTKKRPLCTNLNSGGGIKSVLKPVISRKQALTFAIGTGLVGSFTLFSLPVLNAAWTCGLLGTCNIALYSIMYTLAKRRTALNTHIGAVVGAIPPLIGYAATIPSDTMSTTSVLGLCGIDSLGLSLAFILYCWQFPHFNALSFRIRDQYHKAGYVMNSIYRERYSAFESLLGSIGIAAGSLWTYQAGLSCLGSIEQHHQLLSSYFPVLSLAVNAPMIYYSYRFFRSFDGEPWFKTDPQSCTSVIRPNYPLGKQSVYKSTDHDSGERQKQHARKESARLCFKASLYHLPALILLMLLCKSEWRNKQKQDFNIAEQS